MKYTPLHVHSEYSLLDGLSKCNNITKRIEKIGASACALTDHGSVSGAVDFSREMKSAGLRPLLGSELYVCPDDSASVRRKENKRLVHQPIIAKNLDGWKDLLHIVSLSNRKEHFYHKPRVDFEILEQIGSKGNLICFSGHLGSILSDAITDGESLDPTGKRKVSVWQENFSQCLVKKTFLSKSN